MVGIDQMIATVQLYIHHVKNQEVKIVIRNTRDLFLLSKAYDIASEWMENNNFTIIKH